jgi:hypothetical protein
LPVVVAVVVMKQTTLQARPHLVVVRVLSGQQPKLVPVHLTLVAVAVDPVTPAQELVGLPTVVTVVPV